MCIASTKASCGFKWNSLFNVQTHHLPLNLEWSWNSSLNVSEFCEIRIGLAVLCQLFHSYTGCCVLYSKFPTIDTLMAQINYVFSWKERWVRTKLATFSKYVKNKTKWRSARRASLHGVSSSGISYKLSRSKLPFKTSYFYPILLPPLAATVATD